MYHQRKENIPLWQLLKYINTMLLGNEDRKGKTWQGPAFPPKVSLNKCMQSWKVCILSISLALVTSSAFYSLPKESVKFLFFFFYSELVERPDSGALSASIQPYLGKSRGWRLSVGLWVTGGWLEDSCRAKRAWEHSWEAGGGGADPLCLRWQWVRAKMKAHILLLAHRRTNTPSGQTVVGWSEVNSNGRWWVLWVCRVHRTGCRWCSESGPRGRDDSGRWNMWNTWDGTRCLVPSSPVH